MHALSLQLTSALWMQAGGQTAIQFGDTLVPAVIVQQPADFKIEQPGQPVYLQYQPDVLSRGRPLESLSWYAVDELGAAGGTNTIEIHVQCSPGYFYLASRPGTCVPCPAGRYNLPQTMDQVGVTKRHGPVEPFRKEADRPAAGRFGQGFVLSGRPCGVRAISNARSLIEFLDNCASMGGAGELLLRGGWSSF